jgi:hypothetical protein
MPPDRNPATYTRLACQDGTFTLVEAGSGQAMHSRIGPVEEAREVYVRPSRLAEGLTRGPMVVWDVGMGIAANALAAIRCQTGVRGAHHLRIVSFESRPEGLAFALAPESINHFPWLKEHAAGLRQLLTQGRWDGDGFEWELRTGDFFARVDGAPPADLIFYDFYAPAACPELWTAESFARVRRHAPMALLVTYSAATRVRTSLLEAGFFVGQGAATAAKRETTLASGDRAAIASPLDAGWPARKFAGPENREILLKIQMHPQFAHAIVPG